MRKFIVRFLIAICFVFCLSAEKADLIIFSFDRPLQLHALLESIEHYIRGQGQIHVIYRTSDPAFSCSYDKIKKSFPYVYYHQQGDGPSVDFKPMTLRAFFQSPHEHILFAVDDIIVKDFIDLSLCIDILEETKAYGFYFRLGKNISQCYMASCEQKMPPHINITDNIFSWIFSRGEFDWFYPNTLDMTLYRKKDIRIYLERLVYTNPNELEGAWAGRAGAVLQKKGLFFSDSKIVNLPLNRVQKVYKNNRHMNFLSTQELLSIFNQGLKMDILPLFRIKNKAVHMNYEPLFIRQQ